MEKEYIKQNGSPAGKGAAPTNNTPNDETKTHNAEDIPCFAELWAEKRFENTELLSDYVGQELVISGFESGDGKYGPYVILTVRTGDETRQLRTSSKVVISQVTELKDKIPYLAKPIEKGGANGRKYISLS